MPYIVAVAVVIVVAVAAVVLASAYIFITSQTDKENVVNNLGVSMYFSTSITSSAKAFVASLRADSN